MVDFRYILRIEPIGDPEQLRVGYEKERTKILDLGNYKEGVFNNSYGEEDICKILVYPPLEMI